MIPTARINATPEQLTNLRGQLAHLQQSYRNAIRKYPIDPKKIADLTKKIAATNEAIGETEAWIEAREHDCCYS